VIIYPLVVGQFFLNNQNLADAVYLSLGENNQLIAVGQVNIARPDVVQVLSNPKYEKSGWMIRVPTAILPSRK
jgi:hypothetical protein